MSDEKNECLISETKMSDEKNELLISAITLETNNMLNKTVNNDTQGFYLVEYTDLKKNIADKNKLEKHINDIRNININ